MTMIHQKRSNKTYLNTARNVRTKGSTTGNQNFNIKTGHIKNLSSRLTCLSGKKGERAWDFMEFIKSDLNCIKYKCCWALTMQREKAALPVHQ